MCAVGITIPPLTDKQLHTTSSRTVCRPRSWIDSSISRKNGDNQLTSPWAFHEPNSSHLSHASVSKVVTKTPAEELEVARAVGGLSSRRHGWQPASDTFRRPAGPASGTEHVVKIDLFIKGYEAGFSHSWLIHLCRICACYARDSALSP